MKVSEFQFLQVSYDAEHWFEYGVSNRMYHAPVCAVCGILLPKCP
jgi:hypothetical protein